MLCGETDAVRLRALAVVVWIVLVACCIWADGLTVEALVNALGCAVVVALTVIDIERRIVPNRIVVPALVVALVVQTIRDPSPSGSSRRSAPEASSCSSRSCTRPVSGWAT